MSSAGLYPPSPYPGLQYYRPADANAFAGRDSEAKECAKLLGKSQIVVLHGRTGCGKSSFLRAALKPHLERQGSPVRFVTGGDEFGVVRSGPRPLESLAEDLFDVAQWLGANKEREDIRAILRGDPTPALLGHGDRVSFAKAASGASLFDSMALLADRMRVRPVFVVDQAEEIFTLNLDREAKERTAEDTLAAAEFFEFLRAATTDEDDIGFRIIVSLRTEYKGQFDDMLASAQPVLSWVGFFHLPPLDRNGLIAAIKRPTLDAAAAARVPSLEGLPPPRSVYKFQYEDGVAEEIADQLIAAPPAGGILPAMQVASRRLYEATKLAKGSRKNWTIRKVDLKRFVRLKDPVDAYVREILERMLDKFNQGDDKELTADIDTWYRLLNSLVRVETDGRTATRKVLKADFLQRADDLGCRLVLAQEDANESELRTAIDFLASPDGNAPIIRASCDGGVESWTLGHDALGLALERWRVLYERPLEQHAQMDMNTARSVKALRESDLFEPGDAPARYRLDVVSDHLWDHQLPRFAQARGFAQRLGIDFEFPEHLKCNGLPGRSDEQAKNRGELHQRLEEHRRQDGRHVLAPSWAADFPGMDGQRVDWMAACVSNLFVGNGLVGRDPPDREPLKSTDEVSTSVQDDRLAQVRQTIEGVLAYIVEARVPILSFDGTARALLALAAELTNCDRNEINQIEIRDVGSKTTAYQAKDGAYEAFLNNDDCFMVGTAYGRTLAVQAGARCYFDTQDLAYLLRHEIRDNPSAEPRLLALFRQVCVHTSWHVGVAPEKWDEQRALTLRLAAVALYTSEYVRAFPDDFVRWLYDWQMRVVRGTGLQISRDAMRKTVERALQFVSFEECQRVLFDAHSEFALGSNSMPPQNRSTLIEIHTELLDLRARTLELVQKANALFDKRVAGGAGPDEQLQHARRQKQMAWNNYRVLNFFDSERLMRRALETLSSSA